jgi:hypothetical protein
LSLPFNASRFLRSGGSTRKVRLIVAGAEAFMRKIFCLAAMVSLALLSSAAVAQQSPETAGEAIGHPPPLPGPPPVAGPPPTTPLPNSPPPVQTSDPSSKGYTGAYTPAPASGAASTPRSDARLPEADSGPGLAKVAPDGNSTTTVRAVPCSAFARETDGSTTCVGIPDRNTKASKIYRSHRDAPHRRRHWE